jgi:GTP-binding protein
LSHQDIQMVEPGQGIETGSIEEGRWLFAQECTFVAGVATLDAMPDPELPEIAFAGRSNVGKSSLVNALTGQKMLARTSHTPGRTQQINFFNLARRLMLVDLPGYGYAEAPKSEIKRWTHLVTSYLRGRTTLQRVCLLIDGRHGIKDADLPILRMLDEAAVSYQIVLTKSDKVRPAELAARQAAITATLAKHVAAYPVLAATSSHDQIGIAELRTALAALALPASPDRSPPP